MENGNFGGSGIFVMLFVEGGFRKEFGIVMVFFMEGIIV